MFRKFIGIDWSGDARGGRRKIAIAQMMSGEELAKLIAGSDRWSRDQVKDWLLQALKFEEECPCLVGLDFGFGYPLGAAKTVFGAKSWLELPFVIRELLSKHLTAKSAIISLNEKFNGHEPFRTAHANRTTFYARNRISRFRISELFAPGSLSVWDDVKGAQVALSTFTGLSALADLIEARERKQINFKVFPFEKISEGDNVLAEVYPALFPSRTYPKSHSGDALKIAHWMSEEDKNGTINSFLSIPQATIYGQRLIDAAHEEGWILGVRIASD